MHCRSSAGGRPVCWLLRCFLIRFLPCNTDYNPRDFFISRLRVLLRVRPPREAKLIGLLLRRRIRVLHVRGEEEVHVRCLVLLASAAPRAATARRIRCTRRRRRRGKGRRERRVGRRRRRRRSEGGLRVRRGSGEGGGVGDAAAAAAVVVVPTSGIANALREVPPRDPSVRIRVIAIPGGCHRRERGRRRGRRERGSG
jgi:hypothetical protein